MRKRNKYLRVAVLLLLSFVIVTGTIYGKGSQEETTKKKSVALYLPGVLSADNTMLIMVKEASEKAVSELGLDIKYIEGGYDWSAYEPSVRQLSESGMYDAIMCFTAGFPGILSTVMPDYPDQKYMLMDAVMDGGDQIYSAQFNSKQMAFLAGVFAGCVTISDMPYANAEKKVGMTAGMLYPEMTDWLMPSYENGVHWVDPDIEVVFTVTDTWDDPILGKEIGINMYETGIDIIFMLSNITDQGTIEAGKERGFYCISAHKNMNADAPGVVLTGVLKAFDRIVYETLESFAEGSLEWGAQDTFGLESGMVAYTPDDPLYLEYVPEKIKNKMKQTYEMLKNNEIDPLNP